MYINIIAVIHVLNLFRVTVEGNVYPLWVVAVGAEVDWPYVPPAANRGSAFKARVFVIPPWGEGTQVWYTSGAKALHSFQVDCTRYTVDVIIYVANVNR